MRPLAPQLQDPQGPRWVHAKRWVIALGFMLGLVLLGIYLSDVFNPLLLGLLLAYILNPMVEAVQRRGISRGIAVSLLFGFVLLLMAGSLTFASLRAATHLIEFKDKLVGEQVLDPSDPDDQQIIVAWENLPRAKPPPELRADVAAVTSAAGVLFLDANGDGVRKIGLAEQAIVAVSKQVRERFNLGDLGFDMAKLARAYEDHASELVNVGIGLSQGMRQSFTQVGQFFSYLLLVPVYTFFLAMYFSDLRDSVRQHLPGAYRAQIVDIARKIDLQVAAFFRGKLTVVLVKGVATWLGLWLADVPFSFFIGMGAGILSIIPLVGPLVGGVLAGVLCYTPEGWLLKIVWVVLAFGFAEVVEAVAQPLVLGEAVGLSPLTLIISLFVFGKLLGLFGVLLAVPIACVVKTLFQELALPHLVALAAEPGKSEDEPPDEEGSHEPAVPTFKA